MSGIIYTQEFLAVIEVRPGDPSSYDYYTCTSDNIDEVWDKARVLAGKLSPAARVKNVQPIKQLPAPVYSGTLTGEQIASLDRLVGGAMVGMSDGPRKDHLANLREALKKFQTE